MIIATETRTCPSQCIWYDKC